MKDEATKEKLRKRHLNFTNKAHVMIAGIVEIRPASKKASGSRKYKKRVRGSGKLYRGHATTGREYMNDFSGQFREIGKCSKPNHEARVLNITGVELRNMRWTRENQEQREREAMLAAVKVGNASLGVSEDISNG